MRFLENLIQSISAQLLPTACIACQQFQAESICPRCALLLHKDGLIQYECCEQCSIPLHENKLPEKRCTHCKECVPFFDATVCLDRYDGLLQEPLHQFKYQKRIAYAHGLAKAWNQIIAIPPGLDCADYLLPVPLSREKLHARGFNQSWELARRIDCPRYIHKLPYTLKRHHQSGQQAGSPIHKRQDAICEMFYIDDRYIDLLQNKTVIVFDDVMTTGATLNEIARMLKTIGVSRVINWVLLRTTKPTESIY